LNKRRVPFKLAKLLKKMLNICPDERISIKQVLDDDWFKEIEKDTYKQQKQFLMCEELEYKTLIEKLLNIKFSNKLGRLIYFQLSEQ